MLLLVQTGVMGVSLSGVCVTIQRRSVLLLLHMWMVQVRRLLLLLLLLLRVVGLLRGRQRVHAPTGAEWMWMHHRLSLCARVLANVRPVLVLMLVLVLLGLQSKVLLLPRRCKCPDRHAAKGCRVGWVVLLLLLLLLLRPRSARPHAASHVACLDGEGLQHLLLDLQLSVLVHEVVLLLMMMLLLLLLRG